MMNTLYFTSICIVSLVINQQLVRNYPITLYAMNSEQNKVNYFSNPLSYYFICNKASILYNLSSVYNKLD